MTIAKFVRFSNLLFPNRFRHRPPRQHADQMSAVFGAAVDVAVEAVSGNRQPFKLFGR
jgi:hypothetical protein